MFLDIRPEAIVGYVAAAIPPLVSSLVAYVVAFKSSVWSRGRFGDRAHLIDVSTKKLEFWAKYAALSQSVNNNEQYDQTKSDAQAALLRIKREVNAELRDLSWKDQFTSARLWRSEASTEHKRGFLYWTWSMLMGVVVTVWILVISAIFFSAVPPQAHPSELDWKLMLQVVFLWLLLTGLLLLARRFRRNAKEALYPRPRPFVCDEI